MAPGTMATTGSKHIPNQTYQYLREGAMYVAGEYDAIFPRNFLPLTIWISRFLSTMTKQANSERKPARDAALVALLSSAT